MIQVYFVLAPGSADGQHPVIRQRKLDAGRNERCRGLVAAAMTAASQIVVLQYPAFGPERIHTQHRAFTQRLVSPDQSAVQIAARIECCRFGQVIGVAALARMDGVDRSTLVGRDQSTARPSGACRGGVLMRRSEEHTSELQSLMRISYA